MKHKKIKILILALCVLCLTGCTKTLKDSENHVVTNSTGQSLTENILCKPTDEATLQLYRDNGVDVDSMVSCDEFTPMDGGYEGLWESILVKPLAFLITFTSRYVHSATLAMIIVTIAIRLALYPLTNKTAMQSELIKNATPELNRIEKKYENKTDQDSLMRKSQEMTMVYKKYNINPLSGCLFSFIQIPLLFAFLESINRLPVLYEEDFLGMQMGTTPWVGLINQGNWIFLLLINIIGLTTYFSFSLNRTAATTEGDPMASMSKVMTGMIVVMSFMMPAALGIYWAISNLFTIVQNLIVKRSKKIYE